MNESKIKSCPFCGKEPFISKARNLVSWANGWQIRCANPKCDVGVEIFGVKMKKTIIKLWNTRNG
jgi:hypothetical protein